MALNIKNFPDPRDPANPIASGYAWLSCIAIDLRAGVGRVVFDVHANEASWHGVPVGQVSASLGQGVGSNHFPTLPELMADAEFASAYSVIGNKLYAAAVASLPAFSGATPA